MGTIYRPVHDAHVLWYKLIFRVIILDFMHLQYNADWPPSLSDVSAHLKEILFIPSSMFISRLSIVFF